MDKTIKKKRIAAFVIDCAISAIFSLIAIVAVLQIPQSEQTSFRFEYMRIMIVGDAFLIPLMLKDMLSIGKRCMGLALVGESGQKAKWYQRLIRNLLIGPLILFEIWFFINDRPRVGDLLAKTAVVLKE